MTSKTKTGNEQLKCPECQALLKRRRARTTSDCEMVCGGCGQLFDICETETVRRLRKKP